MQADQENKATATKPRKKEICALFKRTDKNKQVYYRGRLDGQEVIAFYTHTEVNHEPALKIYKKE